MKRVLVIGQSDNPGGVETVIKRYYEAVKSDIQFDLMVLTKTCYDEAYYRQNHCRIYFVKSAQFRHPLAYKKEITAFFTKNKGVYDAIWFNGCDLANSGYIMKMAKKSGIEKRIIHAHNSQLIQTGRRKYLYYFVHHYWKRHIDRYATDFWACSQLAGQFFYKASILKGNRFKIINNAIETEKYAYNDTIRRKIRKMYGLNGKYVIGHVGRFQYQKNHEFLIDIFFEYLKLNDNAVLMLVGRGEDEEKIKQKVTELEINEHVLFMGARSDVNELFQAMDLFLLPSRFEGLPLVLIEAQAAGLKCFASKGVITEASDITNNIEFVSLDERADLWAKKIYENSKIVNDREIYAQLVTDAGYNIYTEAKKFKAYLEEQ